MVIVWTIWKYARYTERPTTRVPQPDIRGNAPLVIKVETHVMPLLQVTLPLRLGPKKWGGLVTAFPGTCLIMYIDVVCRLPSSDIDFYFPDRKSVV